MGDRYLFLHGWATDAWIWDETADALGAEYLNLNLPGHGSGPSWDAPTLGPAMRAIDVCLRESGGTAPIAVGWSLGAQALLSYAAENPKALKALVLVAATPRFTASENFPHGQSRALVKRMILDMKKNPVETLRRFYSLNFTNTELSTNGARAFMERYGATERQVFKYGEITTALETLYRSDLRASLTGIDLPCLVAHGTLDQVCPVDAGRHLASHIKGARLVEFEGAGHAPFITQPERFAGILKDFTMEL